MRVRTLAAGEVDNCVSRLAEILIDAVQGGAGVSFLGPLLPSEAEAFWRGVKSAVEKDNTILFIAEANGEIAGTVQLQKPWPPNQPHRCEVAKLLVHRQYRRKGVGSLLMQALEGKAKAIGRPLITFDAVAYGPSEAFYRSLGYTCAGYIPGYALSPTRQLDATALFYKQL